MSPDGLRGPYGMTPDPTPQLDRRSSDPDATREFFGELSLLAGGLGGASVFAKGETEALRLKSSDLFEMIKQYPRLETVLEQFARAMRTKMRDLPE